MKIMLVVSAILTAGCAQIGHVTRLNDFRADTAVYCFEPATKFTRFVGFADVKMVNSMRDGQ